MMKSNLIFAGFLLVFLGTSAVHTGPQPTAQLDYSRSVHTYRTPGVHLIDEQERSVDFAGAVAHEEMIIISFAFTSCTGTCPVITANLAQVLPELQNSISVKS